MSPYKPKDQKAEEEQDVTDVISGARVSRSGEEAASFLWLVTFTDIMALMLTFFVLLYSMSVPEEEDWKEITDGLHSQFTKTYASQWEAGPKETIDVSKIDLSKALNLGYLNSVLANVIERDNNLNNIILIPQSDHLIISVPQELLFEAGQAAISPKGQQVLFSLGNALARIRNRVEVIGHTDPRAIQNTQENFSSNWDLSLARAGSVASVLENAGYERSVTVRGLSSARYDELPSNMSEEESLSLARRVDIVVMRDDGSQRNVLAIDILNKDGP